MIAFYRCHLFRTLVVDFVFVRIPSFSPSISFSILFSLSLSLSLFFIWLQLPVCYQLVRLRAFLYCFSHACKIFLLLVFCLLVYLYCFLLIVPRSATVLLLIRMFLNFHQGSIQTSYLISSFQLHLNYKRNRYRSLRTVFCL